MKPNKTPRKHAAFASSSRQMKRRPKVKSLLAVLVAFCTVCALTMPAATLEGQAQASCGLAEHTHDESCYESVLVCGQEEGEGHVHDESCYEEVLTCEIPEHTHSEACWAQPEAQAEAGNEENSEAVTGDRAGSDMEAAAGTETGTDTEADTGTGTGTDSSENGDAAEAGSETDSSGNAGTGAGDNGSAESGAESGDGQTGNGTGTGTESGTEAGDQEETEIGKTPDETVTNSEDKNTDSEKEQSAEGQTEEEQSSDETETQPVVYTAKVEKDRQTFNAIVTVSEGAFAPEHDPVLHVDAISDKTELEQTAAVLEESNVEFDGMMAVDVYFTDGEEGKEIEPLEAVSVRFELSEGALEGIDAGSLTVHHLAEKQDGDVQVETVATVGTDDGVDGVVAISQDAAARAKNAEAAVLIDELPELEAQTDESIENPALVAEFEVDGFSQFAITWGWTFATVHYVDTMGNEIQGPQTENARKSFATWVELKDYAGDITDYEYQGAHLNTYNGPEAQWVRCCYEDFWEGTYWEYSDSSNHNNPVRWQTSGYRHIYLVYEYTGGSVVPPSGEVTEDAGVTAAKRADLRRDGNYDLTLSITGDIGTIENKQMVDVLFIVDKSGSMAYAMNEEDKKVYYIPFLGWVEEDADEGRQRIDAVEVAVDNITNGLSENEKLDVWYSLVTFSGSDEGKEQAYDDANVVSVSGGQRNWTPDASVIQNAVDSIDPDGGTNYEAGIYTGAQQLARGRNNALKVVVFLSDGEPTYYYDSDGYTEGDGGTYNENYLEQAEKLCHNLAANYFYTVGVGYDADQIETVLTSLKDAAWKVDEANRKMFTATDTNELLKAFEDIEAGITFFAAKNITITDPLSEYADLVLTSDQAAQFSVSVKDSNGDEKVRGTGNVTDTNLDDKTGPQVSFATAEGGIITVTAYYDSYSRSIILDFPDDYELEEGFTYSISTVITPNQNAVDAGMNSNEASKVPDEETGTHADNGETGFWSNKEDAKVTYVANGAPDFTPFPKPVIRVQEPTTGNLRITKEVSGVTVAGKKYSFTVSTTTDMSAASPMVGDNEVKFIPSTDSASGITTYTATVDISATSVEADVDGAITITGLPLGEYTIAENTDNVAIDGYRFDGVGYRVNDSDEGKAELTAATAEATVAVTNHYTQVVDLSIHKTDSDNHGLEGAEFQLTNSAGKYYTYNAGTQTVSWSNDTTLLNADLSDESIFPIYGLENGEYTLTETKAPDGYQMLSKSVTITVNNGHVAVSDVPGVLKDSDSNSITVINNTGEELPETGGPGTTILTIGGLLLMAGAVGGGYGLRRRRGKEGR